MIPSNGVIVVADTFNHRIRLVTPLGVVTTLAGSDIAAFADGTGAAARFWCPTGVAVIPSSGMIVVADINNNRIRLVTPLGVVTTLAGSDSNAFADGTGAAASFYGPFGVSVIPSSGVVVVADQNNHRIRLVTPLGVVSTLAGSGSAAFAEGTGTAASFQHPFAVAVVPSSNTIVVADTYNLRIRLVTPLGVVTTLAGSSSAVFADGTGAAASFCYPRGVAVIPWSSVLVVADTCYNRIRLVTSPQDPALAACDSTWHHVALAYSPSLTPFPLSAFLDGALAFQLASTVTLPSASASTLRVGWSGDLSTNGGSLYAGSVSDLRIYARALGATEVASLAAPALFTSPSPTFTASASLSLSSSATASSSVSGSATPSPTASTTGSKSASPNVSASSTQSPSTSPSLTSTTSSSPSLSSSATASFTGATCIGSGVTTISYTGSYQFFTVPPRVVSLRVSLWGAAGGSADSGPNVGGGGAYVTGTLNVSPGQALRIIVGRGGFSCICATCTSNSQVTGCNCASCGSNDAWGGGGMGTWGGGGRSAIQVSDGAGGWVEVATAGGGGGSGNSAYSDFGGGGGCSSGGFGAAYWSSSAFSGGVNNASGSGCTTGNPFIGFSTRSYTGSGAGGSGAGYCSGISSYDATVSAQTSDNYDGAGGGSSFLGGLTGATCAAAVGKNPATAAQGTDWATPIATASAGVGGNGRVVIVTSNCYCDAGSYPSVIDSSCTPCAAGFYSAAAGASACSLCASCAAGQFQATACTATVNRVCAACVAGVNFSTTTNAASCTACTTCAAGSSTSKVLSGTAYINNGGGGFGTTLTFNVAPSPALAAGTLITGTGVTSGTAIVSGSGTAYVVSISQRVTAITMSVSTPCKVTGDASCTACPAGSFAAAGAACAACPTTPAANYGVTPSGSGFCVCNAGFWWNNAVSACVAPTLPCPAGSTLTANYTATSNTICTLCAPNTYFPAYPSTTTSSSLSDTCATCPTTAYSVTGTAAGLSYCQCQATYWFTGGVCAPAAPCQAGVTYSATGYAAPTCATCPTCAAGQYAATNCTITSPRVCAPCTLGANFTNTTNTGKCTSCSLCEPGSAPGYTITSSTATICGAPCFFAGTTLTFTVAPSPALAVGTVITGAGVTAGTTITAVTSATVYTVSISQSITTAVTMSVTTACTTTSDATCTVCPWNTYSAGGTALCTSCGTVGVVFTPAGSAHCSCAPGYYWNSLAGMGPACSVCSTASCAAGTFMTACTPTTNAGCSLCPMNTFGTGASACTACPTGVAYNASTPAGSSQCSCADGYSWNSLTFTCASLCVNGSTYTVTGCAAGTYALAGTSCCSTPPACPAGITTTGAATGQTPVTACTTCAPGFSGAVTNPGTQSAGGCLTCSPGSYQDQPGQPACLSCQCARTLASKPLPTLATATTAGRS